MNLNNALINNTIGDEYFQKGNTRGWFRGEAGVSVLFPHKMGRCNTKIKQFSAYGGQ